MGRRRGVIELRLRRTRRTKISRSLGFNRSSRHEKRSYEIRSERERFYLKKRTNLRGLLENLLSNLELLFGDCFLFLLNSRGFGESESSLSGQKLLVVENSFCLEAGVGGACFAQRRLFLKISLEFEINFKYVLLNRCRSEVKTRIIFFPSPSHSPRMVP